MRPFETDGGSSDVFKPIWFVWNRRANMNVLTFEIPGVIQPQERPRFSRSGKNVVTHDSPKSKDFVKLVAWQNKPSELITGPIKLQA